MAKDISSLTIYDKVQEPLSEKQLLAIDNIEEFANKTNELQLALESLDSELKNDINSLRDEIASIPTGESLSVEESVLEDSSNSVKSSGIWTFCDALSGEILKNIPAPEKFDIDTIISKTSSNPVENSAIYAAMDQLSTNVKNEVESSYPTIIDTVEDGSEGIVKSKGIWSFCDSLSTDILDAIPSTGETIAVVDKVTSDGPNPVKSSGIWTFGDALSVEILKNIPAQETITVEETLTKDGLNPVNSKGIYSALDQLSSQTKDSILNLAHDDAVELLDSRIDDIKSLSNDIVETAVTSCDDHFQTAYDQLDDKIDLTASTCNDDLCAISTILDEKIDNLDIQIDIDSIISKTSTNPVENSAIYAAMDQLSDDILDEVIDLQPSIVVKEFVIPNEPNPVKSSGIWTFGDTLSNQILLSTDAKISQLAETGNTYIANNTYISYDIGRFKYNNGRTFESSISVDAFIKAGDGTWNFKNPTALTNTFHAKIIAVSPGDIITYKKKPWNTTDQYYTSYMRALSSFDPNNIANGTKAPLDGSIGQDVNASSDWTGMGNSHQFYPQDKLYTGSAFDVAYTSPTGQWYKKEHSLSTYLGVTNYSDWINDSTLSAMHIHNTELEISVKVPQNTHYLYVSTKYYNYDQEFDSFKINGYELVDQKIEKSASINSFNIDSSKNRNNRIIVIGKNGRVATTRNVAGGPNGSYMLTHFIPCQYGDQIILSENNNNISLRFARSVEYYDENFNLLSVSSIANTNNGFNANEKMYATELYRQSVVLVNPIPFTTCKYVRIGIPNAINDKRKNDLADDPLYSTHPLLSAENATMIQVVHLKDYPQYMLKEHNDFVRFQKKYSDDIKQPLIPQLEGKKLLFFGDSLTRNSLTSTSDLPTSGSSSIFTYDQVSGSTTKVKGYVHYLCEDLYCSYINAGNGGDTAALSSRSGSERESLVDKLSRWNSDGFPANISSEIQKADAAFVEIGSNDWAYSWTEFGDPNASTEGTTTFCDSIRYICTKLHNILGNSVPIVFLTPLRRQQQDNNGTGILYTEQNHLGKTLNNYVEAIKSICQKYNAYVIDLFNICKIDPAGDNHQKGSYYRKRYIPDGTHPSSLGHEVIAKCIEKKLPDIITNFYSSFDTIESMIDQSSFSKPTRLQYYGQQITLNYIENADKSKPVEIDFGD